MLAFKLCNYIELQYWGKITPAFNVEEIINEQS